MDTKLNDNKESVENVSNVNISNNEIKPKNNKKLYAINLIAIIIAVIISLLMTALYPKIKEIGINKNTESPFTNYGFMNYLSKYTFVLYNEALEIKQGKTLSPSDIYLKPKSENENTEDYNFLSENLNHYFSDLKKETKIDFQNLDYVVLDKDRNLITTNSQNNLSSLIEIKNNKELTDKYIFYITINFDENGQMSISNVYGGDEYELKNQLSQLRLENVTNKSGFEGYLIDNSIKNVTFIYGVNKELKYSDRISEIIGFAQRDSFENISYVYILILSIGVIILSLLVPLKFEKEVSLCKGFFKIPFEFIIAISVTIIGFMFAASSQVTYYTLNGDFVNKVLTQIGFETYIAQILNYIFNIIYWSIYCSLIFVLIVSMKNILKIGIIQYLKENLFIIKIFKISTSIFNKILKLLGKIIFSVINSIKKAIKSIYNIDLKDQSNKVIIKVLGINFIIISIFCIAWFFGIILTIIYTIILFVFLRKYLMDVRNKFEILLSATNKIADGNLDVAIEENLGIFNPIKEQLMEIQSGFKKAVNEEVKSQRMKTELISNVSHDLKTPLTSIITYVDLLKNENITKEERKAYISTLDKKSQRLKFLIEDLFEVSRATSGNINLNLVKVDIVELMKQTQIELEDKIKNSNLIVRNNFPENKVVLQLDSQKTFRIFENLLNNVVKYAMEGSRVYIDIIENKERVEITIKNMSAEEINFEPDDIVERFQRGDKSRNTEGSGLGLAIVKSFVEVQGGTFKIDVDGDLFKVAIIFNK